MKYKENIILKNAMVVNQNRMRFADAIQQRSDMHPLMHLRQQRGEPIKQTIAGNELGTSSNA